ncbi:phosphotransferase [Roseospira marina]|uniref:Phosphotransferase n=1 Tax=Roseospira marina TaxID=140057 RepID=A0A5M6IDF7_9PROT|nr:phosphotransferase [Roseospira marina]KAA5605789.1 phosphotransferase [Roseospira marina]MBB4313601.1 Ser/Thr protein kinase RdoA (MazF antagonist) [Roseospira marina]MBB5086763.1 Ser/Thr protein kinase RdoA (MazF antagonist) [Roseospira marina]
MAGLYSDAFIETLRQGAQSLVGAWGLSPRTEVALLTISENATFLATDPERGARMVLRVHRPGYHTRAEIESELVWIADLRAKGVVETPEPLPMVGGGHIASFDHDGGHREVVAFSFMSGAEPSPDADLTEGFHALGAISARLHDHTRTWAQPPGFIRKTWTWDTMLGPTPHWGDWRAALGLTPDGAAVLERVSNDLRARLAAYGTGPDRFGLVHADLRLANLLVEGDRLGVIDFDDCGFGWFGYDFAAAISFLEHEPYIPALQQAWVDGYRTVAALPEEEEAMLPTFVMLRRLLLTAWIASHSETPTAQELGTGYTDGTVMLAERFLETAR